MPREAVKRDGAVRLAHLKTVDQLLARVADRRPIYAGALHLNTRLAWTTAELTVLLACCRSGADIEAVADALGRSPSSCVWRARGLGWRLPRGWRAVIKPKAKELTGRGGPPETGGAASFVKPYNDPASTHALTPSQQVRQQPVAGSGRKAEPAPSL